MNLKDSLPPEPKGMESWILNRVMYPKAFCEDGDKCWCGKCGSHFHTPCNRETPYQQKIERLILSNLKFIVERNELGLSA